MPAMSQQCSNPRPIVILGPTAGGKSELAVRLALALGGQVISADSMQIYRHMDVGTAKPSRVQQQRVVHHMVDIIEPTERFTVADWLSRTEAVIADLQSKGLTPVVVGGTNLYIKALLEGLFDGPGIDEALREELAATPLEQLHPRLQAVDPQAAARIHPNDRKKLVRAIEVYHLTGKPISALQTQWEEPTAQDSAPTAYRHNPILIGLEWPAEAINPRINARVKAMFHPEKVDPQTLEDLNITRSLADEVADLQSRSLLGDQARQALGYKQVLEALAGQISMEEACEKTKILTRRFAKTQRTWLRRYRNVKWLSAPGKTAEELVSEAVTYVKTCL